jgi:glycosyltransferase involved in cell wall biosynthesis
LGADVIYHDHNSGYGAAMQSLFTRARQLKADVFVTLDGDGQHDPDEIKRLVKPITDGKAEVVLGSRFIEKAGTTDMPLYRQIGIKVITKLVNGAAKDGVSDAQSGFRAYSKYALEHLGGISEDGMSASVELLRSVHENGLKVCEVPITCKYEDSVGVKTSTENPVSHGIGVIMSIVRLIVEERPLTALGIPGILFLVTGLSLGIWMLEIYTIENIIVTNIALASLAFTIFGFFMLSTSITLYAISRLTRKLRDRS